LAARKRYAEAARAGAMDRRGCPRRRTDRASAALSAALGGRAPDRGPVRVSPPPPALIVQRSPARRVGAPRSIDLGRRDDRVDVGLVQLSGARQVDLHGAAPGQAQAVRDAAGRLPRISVLLARSVGTLPRALPRPRRDPRLSPAGAHAQSYPLGERIG